MKTARIITAITALGVLLTAGQVFGQRVRVPRPPHPPRVKAAVTVRPGFPIKRPIPHVVVRPAHRTVVVTPHHYLSPVVWVTRVVTPPPAGDLVWEDSESLDREDGWTDFTLNVEDRGRKLFLQVADGKARLNFAEIVFENGEAQVVDFNEHKLASGFYSLLDFADGRKVDHVRMVASAVTDEVRIVVKMAK